MAQKLFYKNTSNNYINHKNSLLFKIWQKRSLFLMFLPGFSFIIIFSYVPMYGIIIAFKDYSIGLGIWKSPWVGLLHFKNFFSSPETLNVLKNTILISLYRLIWGFPAPIILAILLNESGNTYFKRFVQTVSYLPHFLSWVIVSGVVINILSPNTGIINHIIKLMGMKPIMFMTSERWFRTILVLSGIWKEIGWGAIIYLAAICGIDYQMYEAAIIDGATRFQRIRYITLPSMSSVISITLLLSMGSIMNAGFDQIFNMYNPAVLSVADIIDTYIYRVGLIEIKYSFNTAVGLFKSVVNLILMFTVNSIIRQLGEATEYGLW